MKSLLFLKRGFFLSIDYLYGMKVLFSILASLIYFASFAQIDTILWEDFEKDTIGNGISFINADSHGIYEGYASQFPDSTWSIWTEKDSNKTIANSSLFFQNVRCNDWIIIPNISITNPNTYFSWKHKSIELGREDAIIILQLDSNFNQNELNNYDEHVLNDTTQSRITAVPYNWTTKEILLENIDSMRTTIAIRHFSKNKHIVLVDDLLVYEKDSIDISIISSELAHFSKSEATPVAFTLKNNGIQIIDSLYANFIANDDTVFQQVKFTNLSLEPGNQTTLTFPSNWFPKIGKKQITISINTHLDSTYSNNTIQDSIDIVTDYYVKNSLIESFTNIHCTPCPHFLPDLTESINNSGNHTAITYPITFGTNDSLTMLDQLNFEAKYNKYQQPKLPSSIVNGKDIILSPILQEEDYDLQDVNYSDFNLSMELNRLDPSNLSISFTVNIDTLNVNSLSDYTIHTAIAESEIEFKYKPGSNEQYIFKNIVRKLLPNADGHVIQQLSYNYNYSIDTNFIKNPKNLFVASWIEDSTGVIQQSSNAIDRLWFMDIMEKSNTDMNISIYPNPSSNIIQINGTKMNENAQVINAQGKVIIETNTQAYTTTISINQLEDGFYFLMINGKIEGKFIKN